MYVPNTSDAMGTLAMTLEVSESLLSSLPEEQRDPYFILYKREDDVKQDEFIVQLIKMINILWLENGLDLFIVCYKVIATGKREV